MAHIFQLNISKGGVPKLPVREAQVNWLGVLGDLQRDTEHHGGPERALCLYALERILALQSEGHPVFPGALGENITTAGLEWDQVTPGRRLRLGDEVVIEITRYTTPCETIAASFHDGRFVRVSQKVHPGWSRVYARVLRPGRVQVGMPIEFV
ncbi:MAG: MOSC domain-containing protein [Ardenticatenia bacterium]|nr:MAG: MOSC domain-containing protein [Ardenticatenia bacterium]